MTNRNRCAWAESELAIEYHDTEWGVPRHDDRVLFEFLILEGAQAGLSWETILRKRANYRKAFFEFDPLRVTKMTKHRIEKLLDEPSPAKSIVRNRAKVNSAVSNARAFLAVADEFGSFDTYVWRFIDPSGARQPRVNRFRVLGDIPTRTPESVALSKDLQSRGFSFVGPTICYAFMQAIGMVNDHTADCFRHRELKSSSLQVPDQT